MKRKKIKNKKEMGLKKSKKPKKIKILPFKRKKGEENRTFSWL